jgi:hypothetical protein
MRPGLNIPLIVKSFIMEQEKKQSTEKKTGNEKVIHESHERKDFSERNKINTDAFVIADPEGNYYVVPREHLELSKVSPAAKAEVDKQLGSKDIKPVNLGSGFSFIGVMTLQEGTNWTHYSPEIAWPN